MPMLFDMKYILMVLLPGLIMSGVASMMVKSAFAKYSQVGTRRGLSGAQAAQIMLDNAGIHDVRIVPTHGFLSDHYNPATKTLALSEQVFANRSVAAVGGRFRGQALGGETNLVAVVSTTRPIGPVGVDRSV